MVPMSTQGTPTIHELAAPLDQALRELTNEQLLDHIALQRAAGAAFGLIAESCRHDLARRTGEASQ